MKSNQILDRALDGIHPRSICRKHGAMTDEDISYILSLPTLAVPEFPNAQHGWLVSSPMVMYQFLLESPAQVDACSAPVMLRPGLVAAVVKFPPCLFAKGLVESANNV
jgi:hypothetical protein